MDTETLREIERARDDAVRTAAQMQRIADLILSLADALLQDGGTRPGPRRRRPGYLTVVKVVAAAGTAAAVRILAGHRTAAVATITAATLAVPLAAAPLVVRTPVPPRPAHHARRHDPAPAPAITIPPARPHPRASVPPRPARHHIPAPQPSPSPAAAPSPSPAPSPLISVSAGPPRAGTCTIRLGRLCVRLLDPVTRR